MNQVISVAPPPGQIDASPAAGPPRNGTLPPSISRMVALSAARSPIELECECQDVERCPAHHGYD
jgi:hypothetical protein